MKRSAEDQDGLPEKRFAFDPPGAEISRNAKLTLLQKLCQRQKEKQKEIEEKNTEAESKAIEVTSSQERLEELHNLVTNEGYQSEFLAVTDVSY
jgi:hypothetical protein